MVKCPQRAICRQPWCDRLYPWPAWRFDRSAILAAVALAPQPCTCSRRGRTPPTPVSGHAPAVSKSHLSFPRIWRMTRDGIVRVPWRMTNSRRSLGGDFSPALMCTRARRTPSPGYGAVLTPFSDSSASHCRKDLSPPSSGRHPDLQTDFKPDRCEHVPCRTVPVRLDPCSRTTSPAKMVAPAKSSGYNNSP